MNTNQGISRIISLIMKIASFFLHALVVILIGLFSAVIGFSVGATIFGILGLGLFGAEGYEAGGPIGFVLGALIGLVGSGLLLFRKPVIHEKAPEMENYPMTNPLKTNRLALVSLSTGLITLLVTSGMLVFTIRLLGVPEGFPPDPALEGVAIRSDALIGLGTLLAPLISIGAVITGVLALLEIRRKSGLEKGKFLAWAGIISGASWFVFRLGWSLFFILALIPVR